MGYRNVDADVPAITSEFVSRTRGASRVFAAEDAAGTALRRIARASLSCRAAEYGNLAPIGMITRFLLAVSMFAPAALAGDAFYLGAWKITSAAVAPWADTARTPDAAEMKSLVGKTIVIKVQEIVGPRQAACKDPKYEVKDYPADMLFQGAFGEMHERDRSVDPAKMAAKIGFRGSSWKTLETGCANELDYHFADKDTAEFGLNDYVYTLKRQ